ENEVKEAYFKLARRFHPDTPLDPTLQDLRAKRENVFLRLGAAYETLRNASSRAQYERMVEPRSPRRHPVEASAGPRTAPPSVSGPPLPPPVPAAQGEERQRRAAEN